MGGRVSCHDDERCEDARYARGGRAVMLQSCPWNSHCRILINFDVFFLVFLSANNSKWCSADGRASRAAIQWCAKRAPCTGQIQALN